MDILLKIIWPISELSNSPSLNIIILCIFFSSIILIFSVVTLKFFLVYKKCANSIRNAKEVFEQYSLDNINTDFEKLDQQITPNNVIYDSWNEFKESLVFIVNRDGEKENVFSTIDAQHFFNETTIAATRLNYPFYNAFPGLLTGIGIFGTFVGLSIGISQINLSSDDLQILKEGIKGLLNGVATAFYTSLYGIFFSIVFSITEKTLVNKLRQNILKLQESIDKVFIRKTPEKWLSKVYEESVQQTQELKRFNSDLAISIATALDNALEQRFTPTFNKLLDAIEKLAEVGSEQIADKIKEGAGQEITNLSNVLEQTSKTLASVINYTEETYKRISDNVDKHVEGISDTLKNMLEDFTEKQQINDQKTQERIQNMLIGIEESLRLQQEKIDETTSRAKEEFLGQINTVSEQIARLLAKFEEQTSKNINEMQKNVGEIAGTIKEIIGQVVSRYQEERQSIDELLKQMKSAIMEVNNVIKEAGSVAEAFEKSAEPVKEAGQEIINAIQSFQELNTNFADTAVETQKQMRHISEHMEKSLENIKIALDTTQAAWKAYEDKFGDIRTGLEAVFNEISKGLQDYSQITSQGITEYLQKLDEHLNKINSHIVGAIDELGDTVEGLEVAINQLNNKKLIS